MPENLEDLIRDFAKRGEITHLSLTPRSIERGKKHIPGWGATFAPASSFTNTFAEDTDPVAALVTALTEAKLRRKAEFNDGDKARPTKKGLLAAADAVEASHVSDGSLDDLLS